MKAIVLAAGYGTRMQPLSQHLPKPLMPVVGQPLLWHIITKLVRSKAAAVGVNCHHMAGRVQAYALSAGFGLPVTVSHEPVIRGSGGGIGGFRDFLAGEDYFIVHNGDMLSSIDIAAAHEAYLRDKPLCAMVLHDAPGFNNVSIDSRGRIIDLRDILKPAGTSRRLAYSGICFLSTAILRFIPAGESDLVVILLEIIKREAAAVRAIIAQQCAWCDVGSPASYLRAHRDILIGRQPLIEPACMPRSAVYAGTDTRIGSGADLAGFVSAGNNCSINSGCCLENCIVWDGTEIMAGATFKNTIIGPGWSVQAQEAL
jgi:NDP-sugar pyrophosphorylase family protein